MTVNQLHQVPATRPMKGCFQSFDRIAQSVGCFSRVSQAARQQRHRHDRRFPIHSVCIPIIAPSYELRAGGLVGLRSKTSLEIVRIRVSLPPTWFSPPPAHLSAMPSNRSKVSLIRHAPLRRALTELPLPVTMPATSPSRLFVDVCTSTKVHEELSGQGYDAFR